MNIVTIKSFRNLFFIFPTLAGALNPPYGTNEFPECSQDLVFCQNPGSISTKLNLFFKSSVLFKPKKAKKATWTEV